MVSVPGVMVRTVDGAVEQAPVARASPAKPRPKSRLVNRVIMRSLGRAPDGPGSVDNQAELGPLRVLVDRVAAGDAGEAALRGQRQALEVDEARRLVDAPTEVVRAFQDRRLGRHQSQHDATILGDMAQGREVAGALAVVLQEVD